MREQIITRQPWAQPRLVDNDHWWMQLRDTNGIRDTTGEPIVVNEGTVTWAKNGSGTFGVFVQRGSYGFTGWPSFRALSDAQDFVERLLDTSIDEVKALHWHHRSEVW